ncbi:hypothetical protein AB0H76_35255 [Nocardia sp. NPDC050712]|uniref:hypothetical protein n=1 Tax=Nocardia sp. NPDC050712 TaxID=3155518 RepID=UPI0033DDE148
MSQTLADVLNARDVDRDSVHQAVRYYLGERLDDRTPDEMRAELAQHGGEESVTNILRQLTGSEALLDRASLMVLASSYAEPGEQDRVVAALDQAKAKLPVIEVGMIALACVYGMYLIATGGIRKSETIVVRKPNGAFEERSTVEYTEPGNIIGAILELLQRSNDPAP